MYRFLLPLSVVLAVLGVVAFSQGEIAVGMAVIIAAFAVGPGLLSAP
jgi:hypothetical protein